MVVGNGIFSISGVALKTAGPGGLLFGVTLLGVVAICVGETVSELVQLFPTPNAIFEYTRAFIDEDWAWIATILYWYCYATTFAFQLLGTANLLDYWEISSTWQLFICYGIGPWILMILNLLPVQVSRNDHDIGTEVR
jgi:amino acid transporter